jgi:hypothetical protein
MGKKWIMTQNNPQKWLRDKDCCNDSPYNKEEWDSHYNGLDNKFRNVVSYAKVAHEIGETGTPHLQGVFLLALNERKSFLYKRLPKADFEMMRADVSTAVDYIGNESFVHSDKRGKGGTVQWIWEIGSLETATAPEVSATEKRCQELKTLIDNGKGKDIKALWHSDFYFMLRYYRGVKEYINDVHMIGESSSYNDKLREVKP